MMGGALMFSDINADHSVVTLAPALITQHLVSSGGHQSSSAAPGKAAKQLHSIDRKAWMHDQRNRDTSKDQEIHGKSQQLHP